MLALPHYSSQAGLQNGLYPVPAMLTTPPATHPPSLPPADIMCVAMNRSLANVILGGYGTPAGKGAAAVQVRDCALWSLRARESTC